jgi:hypothetical protein
MAGYSPTPGAEPPINATAAGGAVAVLPSFRVGRIKRKIITSLGDAGGRIQIVDKATELDPKVFD